ncbi:Panacea domain-containing protein [Methanoplanus endosymbiosus]|uniref:Panacea domain-containing protein n=1 Tax=Methanoplanus endosymbiosus TaxID=33865 RepID=A0A9E7PMV8_9EURY|nr:Panacea domain-containing protein [Methanoplanus endosymbiosus]UUX93168.1 Panacea domain-containing protein [Methanoplanus endosymbiosus]
MNAIMYAFEKYPDAGQDRIVNIPFLIDLISYNQIGTTILDNTYLRMPYGPVSAYAYSKMEELLSANMRLKKVSGDESGDAASLLQKRQDLSRFSIYEYYLLNKVLSKAGDMECEEFSDYINSFNLSSEAEGLGTIPLKEFYLDSDDAGKLSSFGFSHITEEQEFTRSINLFSKEVSGMGRPDKVLVNWKLNEIRDKFPEYSGDLFYDIYLDWDEAFRLLVKDYHVFADVLGRQFCENYCITTNECSSSEYSSLVQCAHDDYSLKIKEISDFLADDDNFSKKLPGKNSDKAFIELIKSCNNSLNVTKLKMDTPSDGSLLL